MELAGAESVQVGGSEWAAWIRRGRDSSPMCVFGRGAGGRGQPFFEVDGRGLLELVTTVGTTAVVGDTEWPGSEPKAFLCRTPTEVDIVAMKSEAWIEAYAAFFDGRGFDREKEAVEQRATEWRRTVDADLGRGIVEVIHRSGAL